MIPMEDIVLSQNLNPQRFESRDGPLVGESRSAEMGRRIFYRNQPTHR
jgi:hypothetical protein